MNATQVNRGNNRKSDSNLVAISLIRLALALFAFLFFSLHAFDNSGFNVTPYKIISIIYCVYAILLFACPQGMQKMVPKSWLHWIDVLVYATLIVFSNGRVSTLFSFFFFAILVAAFLYGFKEGLKVTIACVLLSFFIHLFPFYSTITSAIYPLTVYVTLLLVLGYFIAWWGGLVVQQSEKSKLLCDVSCNADINLNNEQHVGFALQKIGDFYRAEFCLAVIKMPNHKFIMFEVPSDAQKPMLLGQRLNPDIAEQLLIIPQQYSIYSTDKEEWVIPSLFIDKPSEMWLESATSFGEAIYDLLEVDSFASVPLHVNGKGIGRLFLTNCSASFDVDEISFLQQLINQLTPCINAIVMQKMVSDKATDGMLSKISIDMHDSAIQPYIGLKLGLEALRRKIAPDEALGEEVDELVNMTAESIAELRRYISALKFRLGMPLVSAILELAKKYQKRHGIQVIVNADSELRVNDRLTSEIFQLIREGLSNIHRHTTAKQAEINLYDKGGQLVIEMINQDDNNREFNQFKPRSIAERVRRLGGKLRVSHRAGNKTNNGITIVMVEIPLQNKERAYAKFV